MSGAVVARDICFFASEIGKFSPLVWNGFLRNSAYLLNSELEWAFCLGLIEKKSASRDNDEVVHCGRTITKKTGKITISEQKFQFRNSIICKRKKQVSH